MNRLLFVALALTLPAFSAGRFALRDVSPTSLELIDDAKPVFVYNHGMMLKEGVPEDRRRSGYVHPLYAPNGAIVTDDFPKDHYHHRGVFWGWPSVKIDGTEYDLWMMKGGLQQRFVRWTSKKLSGDRAIIAAENGWYAGDRCIMREDVEVVAHPVENGRRDIDFTLRLTALERPVTLQGEMPNKKGYGGFNIRFGSREDTVLRIPEDDHAQDSDMKPLPWAELVGTFEGKRAGARITQDANNPGFPNGWCLRNYGFLGANYPGLDPLTLHPGKPLTLKYTLTVFAE